MAVRETADAKKERYAKKDLKKLLDGASKLVVAKGKKVESFDLRKDPPSAAEIASVALGPTGNLRAPAIRSGKTWLIGFNEEAYAEALG